MAHNSYERLDQQPRFSTVRNNNPFNPFSSNTTNPQQWGSTPKELAPVKDFVEMISFSAFFAYIYWASIFVTCLINNWFQSWISWRSLFLLTTSLVSAAAICFKRCELWHEYGALEYWQPIKDFLRAGIKKKGFRSLGSGILIFLATIVYGPFLVGAVAWVDELGQREHRD